MNDLPNCSVRKPVCFDLRLKEVEPKLEHEHPLSSSKCWELEEVVKDNGKVVSASQLATTVTEQDFITLSHFYKFKMSISNFRWYDKQYLPRSFVTSILELFKRKTTLKGVEDKEIEYMISKNMLNAAYGMSVTNPIRDILEYNGDYLPKRHPDIYEAIETYNKGVKRFLFYPWGVWVTAYARRNLFKAIEHLGEDYVYADTDSTKMLHPEKHADFYTSQNQQILDKIEAASAFQKIPIKDFSPITKKGVTKTIGFWENEGVYDEFKTLGAKRYLVRNGDSYTITLAGANKKSTMEYLLANGNPFNLFDDNLVIPPDYSGRLTHTYIDDPHDGVLVDYLGQPYNYHEETAIHMEKSQYELTMADDFINYLKGVQDLE